MRSQKTGLVVPKTCRSYLCSECSEWLRAGAARAISRGAKDGRPEGWDAVFLTFTEPSEATLDVPAFGKRQAATLKRLQRRGWIGQSATVVEFQRRGALHAHVVAHAPAELCSQLEDRRSRSSYRFRMHELRPMLVDLGWGPVCDAVAVGGFGEVGAYCSKALGSYLSKQAQRAFKDLGAERIRPVRLSRGWYPGGLRQAQEDSKIGNPDPGPWEDVTTSGPCH
jgi:hypothetical protein